jgi:hypothetical protein
MGKSEAIKKVFMGTDHTILYIDDSKTDPVAGNTAAGKDIQPDLKGESKTKKEDQNNFEWFIVSRIHPIK